jgi:phosphoglycerate dehydrogenase-like enzyme
MAKIAIIARSFCNSKSLRKLAKAHLSGHQIEFFESDEKAAGDALARALATADGAIIGREVIDSQLLSQCTNLKVVSLYGVGHDNINLSDMEKAGVTFSMAEGVNSQFAAEHTIGLILSLLRNIQITSEKLKQEEWFKNGGVSLINRTVGIVGAGNVGSKVARVVKALGAKILICDIIDKKALCTEFDCRQLPLDEVARNCDILSLHVPLTDQTKDLVDRRLLNLLGKGYLINTCRAEVVVENDLIDALNCQLSGAALDVWMNEPHINYALAKMPQVVGTPHIGGNSLEAVEAMGLSAINGITCYFSL